VKLIANIKYKDQNRRGKINHEMGER